MRVEDKKTASSVKPKAEPSKVTNNVNTAILPADPLDGALRADDENVVARNEHHAPSGNVFFVGKDDLQVVIGDKSPIKLCSYIDVEAEGYDRRGGGRCRLVRFADTFGKIRKATVMMSELVKNQNSVLATPKSRTGWLYNQPAPYFLRLAAR